MWTLTSLLLLHVVTSFVQSDIVLTQPGSELKKPGESVKLSCQTSGFSLSSSWMAWIRQKPGMGPEWLGEINPDGSTINYIASIRGRFIISKDNSAGLLNLQMNSLQAEDMAVYYCAKYSGVANDYFDYWGKGTMVTITSASPTKPALFPLVASCGSGTSGDVVSVGCLATGFLPDSLTFKWTDNTGKELTPFRKYPSVLNGETYSSSSMVSLSTSDWNSGKSLYCEAKHPQGVVKTSPIMIIVFEASCPKVNLKDADQKELFISNRAVLSCEVEGENLTDAQVSWTEGGKPVKGQLSRTKTKAVSNISIEASKWYSGEVFECIVQLKSQKDPIKRQIQVNNRGLKQEPTLYILPPSEAEIQEKGSATLVCLVTGFFPENIYVMWGENGNLKEEGITSRPVKNNNGLYSAMSYLTIAKDQWEKNEYFCAVKHPSLGDNKTAPRMKTIKKEDGKCQCPTFVDE